MPIRPIQAADDVYARAERMASHATRVKDSLIADDMRRSALALGVAALDTYLHWAIADAPLVGTLPTALASLEVPFGDMVDLSEEVVRNRQKIRPKVRARNVLERVILKQTFQSPRGVEGAMTLLGKRNGFAKIATEIVPPQGAQDIKDRLDVIARRRNQIVHEGDLQRQSRPQNVKRVPIDSTQVDDDLAWLRTLVIAIDAVLA